MCTRLGPAHLDALQAQDRARLIRRHDAMAHEVAAERTARGARGRVLVDAEPRREHPAVDGRPVRAGLAREDEHRVVVDAGRLAQPVEGVEIG